MKNLKKIKQFAVLSVSTFLAAATLVGCGNSYNTLAPTKDANYLYDTAPAAPADYEDYYYPEYEEYSEDYGYNGGVEDKTLDSGSTYSGSNSVKDTRKIIRTVNVDVETVEYDKFIAGLNATVEKLGGYIESEYSYNGSAYKTNKEYKHSSITIRVPDEKLDEVISSFSGNANITQKTTSTQDVTLSYVDTESKKEMYLAEQESLLALLEKAESVEDIVYLTERISQVRYNIESMESTLRTLDDLVSYATLNVSVQEVEIYTPAAVVVEEEKTVGQKMAEGFKASLLDVVYGVRDFFVNLVIASPYIIRFLVIVGIIAGIIVAIVNIIKFNIKRNKKKVAEAQKKLQEIREKEESNDKQN